MFFLFIVLLSCLICFFKSYCMLFIKNVVWFKFFIICNFSEKDMYGDFIKDSNLVCIFFFYKKMNLIYDVY